ncbi:DUF1273 family protein [Pseudoflavonifractor sp. 524-17]|uniref:SLOG family protein n=1 Tax=Pseudoflavonifractor sp. 524-17 TaxID=2304577 RepID=UPI00137AB152|nr:SLOG family protein [Pseudoflavonifractor sp. 524-17]NCE66419.1 DUF1273 family protein [Pseudoflavonifractor sp. 524-17]
MRETTCAFTGHRPHKFPWKYDEADPQCIALKRVLVQQVGRLAAAGVTDFFSGMADGSDVWLSQMVLELRTENPALKLHCPPALRGAGWQMELWRRRRGIILFWDRPIPWPM